MDQRIKQGVFLALKILILVLGMFICFMVSSQLAGMTEVVDTSPQLAQAKALSLLLVCFLHTLVLTFYIKKAGIQGWTLVGSVFLIFFGVTTFLSQIEAVVFLKYLVSITSLELIGKILLEDTILSILVSLLFVFILSPKFNHKQNYINEIKKFNFTWGQWVGKFALICVLYVILYFGFGYFVAWQTPAVQKFYAGLTLPNWMLFLQFFRAIVWGFIALLIIKTMRGKVWQTGLATALLFSVLMAAGLLIPGNPIMPDEVRLAHFKEIMLSNFLFGWLVIGIINFGSGKDKLKVTNDVQSLNE